MCQSLEEWIDQHPTVPARNPGDRQQFSLYLSKEEAQRLSELAQDHRLRGIHGGKAYEVVRHALYYYIPQLLDLLDEGYRPIAELMRADIEKTGIGQTIDQINDYYETRGRELNMLLAIGETDKALEHYEHVVQFAKRRTGVWAGLLMRLLREHSEMVQFRSTVRTMGVVEDMKLRSIEEENEV